MPSSPPAPVTDRARAWEGAPQPSLKLDFTIITAFFTTWDAVAISHTESGGSSPPRCGQTGVCPALGGTGLFYSHCTLAWKTQRSHSRSHFLLTNLMI